MKKFMIKDFFPETRTANNPYPGTVAAGPNGDVHRQYNLADIAFHNESAYFG